LACVLAHCGKIFLAVTLAVEALEFFHQPRKEGFEVTNVGNRAGLAVLKKFDLAENIVRVIVQRRRGDEDDALATANLREPLISLIRLSAEAVRFINENVVVVLDALAKQFVELASGLKPGLRHSEIAENIRPR